MGIRAALASLITIQESLSITDPIEASVIHAYKYVPNANDTLKGNIPCFVNTYTFHPELRSSSLRELVFDIRMQFACYDASRDRASDIATAFLEAFINKLDVNISLNGSISHSELRGGEPTLVGFVWDNFSYIGFDTHLMVHIKDVIAFEA